MLEGGEGQWVCGLLVDGDDTRWGRMARPKSRAEKPLGSLGVPSGTPPEVDGVTLGIDGTVQVIPPLLALDLRRIDTV